MQGISIRRIQVALFLFGKSIPGSPVISLADRDKEVRLLIGQPGGTPDDETQGIPQKKLKDTLDRYEKPERYKSVGI